MKNFEIISLGVLLAIIVIADAKSVQKRDCPFKKYFDENKPKCTSDISVDNMGRFMRGKVDNDEIRCYIGCVYDKAGLVKDGKVQLSKMREVISDFVNEYNFDKARADHLFGVVADCAVEAEKGNGQCEVASNFFLCFKNKEKGAN